MNSRLEEQQDKDRKVAAFDAGPADATSAAASRLGTLFAEFGEETEARDGRPREDDAVLARDVLAELLGHQAVELRLVLQGGQAVRTLALLQVDRDLRREDAANEQINGSRQLCFSFF